MPSRLLLLFVLLSAGAALACAASGPAGAGASIPIIRDGLWTGPIPGTHSRGLAIVGVRHHRVVYLRFTMPMDCHNHDTGEDYDRRFIGGKSFPPTTIPRAGRLTRHFYEMDAGYKGMVTAELDWRGRRFALLASFSIDVPRVDPGLESCNGFVAVPARWTRAAVPAAS